MHPSAAAYAKRSTPAIDPAQRRPIKPGLGVTTLGLIGRVRNGQFDDLDALSIDVLSNDDAP